ncbi:hypothetical protein [Polymorphobacter megasporae]|uniref:hypothetical protein n=1 Tax=Glacieibacterium megasporae TaxID=2835787 RepID=UPI001C1E6F99|nr:hypothetical protein [Polymorphobacter megasporae]UAJ12288.1 hypothetical protein KTC28_20925 [Polymorphobacter megasporae]
MAAAPRVMPFEQGKMSAALPLLPANEALIRDRRQSQQLRSTLQPSQFKVRPMPVSLPAAPMKEGEDAQNRDNKIVTALDTLDAQIVLVGLLGEIIEGPGHCRNTG